MGYFDSVKSKQTNGLVVAPTSNVIQLRDDIHPYAEAIRKAWLGRLDGLQRPWVKGASWDTNSFVTARKLVELANSGWAGYDLNAARNDYFDHAPHDSVWDKRDKCWQQALERTGGNSLPEPPPNTPVPDVTVLDLDEQVSLDAGPPLNPIIDWHELFATDDDGEEWILEPLLPARRMVALYSAPKAGKSLLMLELAVGIARGSEVLGVKPDQPRNVLYVDFENDPRGDIRTRLEAMEVTPGDLDGLRYLTFPSLAKFDTAQGALDLMRHVQHYECEVVVIDTVSRAVMGEENENDTWLNFYRHTGLALKRAEIACIRLDHSGKDRDKGMRGGSAKYGDVDAVWRLTALNDDTILLECTDHRMTVPAKLLTLVRQNYPLAHVPAGDAWQIASDAKTQAVDDLLDQLSIPCSASVREAGKALRQAGHSADNRALSNAVKSRKMRLDLPPSSVPRNTSEHPGTARGSVPRHGGALDPVRNTPGGTSEQGSERSNSDPDELVSCKLCFRPTSEGVAGKNDGHCQACSAATPQPPDTPPRQQSEETQDA